MVNYEPIDDFLNRVRKLNKANKEMRLSYDEAQTLAITIGQMMSQLAKKGDSTPITASLPSVIDGGTFPRKS